MTSLTNVVQTGFKGFLSLPTIDVHMQKNQMRSVGHTSQLQISCCIQKCLNLYACFVSCVEGTCDRYGDQVSLSEIIPFTRASTGNFMSRLVFTRSPQPYFPFPIRVTIAGDGLGDVFKNILPIRVQDKHEIFIQQLCFGFAPFIDYQSHWSCSEGFSHSSSFFFLSNFSVMIVPHTCGLYVGIICANPQVFALLTNVYLSFLFVCYFSVLTETYVDCPDGSQCLDYETCCMMDTGHYGCCPLPKAVCCSDEEHCCPEGYR